MKRFILIILSLFIVFINISVNASQNYTKKDISTVASDGFNIKSTLTYPKDKTIKKYKTVVFLHSLGYNSQWWGDLPKMFTENGYAVLMIDFRGHGTSIYNAKLTKTSWKKFTNNAYAKFPDDVVKVVQQIKDENPKRDFFDDWAIIGSDIGASAGIIAADRLKDKPKTIVILSPVVETRSLYIPVSLAHLDFDIFSISGCDDTSSLEAEKYLKRFAQKEFTTYTSQSKASGMVMLRMDEGLPKLIYEWVKQYLD